MNFYPHKPFCFKYLEIAFNQFAYKRFSEGLMWNSTPF